MNINRRHSLQAFATNFELACGFSALAIFVDILWVLSDALNHFRWIYCIIGLGLVLALIGTISVLYRHNKNFCKDLRKELLTVHLLKHRCKRRKARSEARKHKKGQ